MPKNDPEGYLPNVKKKRSKGSTHKKTSSNPRAGTNPFADALNPMGVNRAAKQDKGEPSMELFLKEMNRRKSMPAMKRPKKEYDI